MKDIALLVLRGAIGTQLANSDIVRILYGDTDKDTDDQTNTDNLREITQRLGMVTVKFLHLNPL